MNWNSNDTKYILKRFIIYVLICVAMFIISTWKAHALTFTQEVTRHSVFEFTTSKQTKQANANTTISFDYTFDNVINCDTDMCGLEFNYLATAKLENYNSNANTYQAEQNFIASSGLVVVSNSIYNVSINGNSIVVIVPKNSTLKDLSLYFATNQYPSANVIATLTLEVSPRVTIYNVSGNIAQAINNNTQAVNDVNNSINSDTVQESDADDFSNNQAFSDSTGLESVIQLPLNMVNSLTSTCQPIQITIPFIDYTGEIPCMSTIYQSKFNTLYTIVKIVINGFFVYRLLLKVYELVHNAKQPDEDKLEVIDL